MNPICGTCEEEMVCVKNGILVVAYNKEGAFLGRAASGDQFRCQNCGHTIVVNVGKFTTLNQKPNPAKVICLTMES